MKQQIYIAFLIAFVLSACSPDDDCKHEAALASALERLDIEMARSDVYEQAKAERIDRLKQALTVANADSAKAKIYDTLIDEYESYKSDSTLYYINLAMQYAHGDTAVCLDIRKANVLSHAGLFNDAKSILDSYDASKLPMNLQDEYYETRRILNQYEGEYAVESNDALGSYNDVLKVAFVDSVVSTSEPGSFINIINRANQLIYADELQQAIDFQLENLGKYESGTREYSIMTSILGYIYSLVGDRDKTMYYNVESAISDIKAVVKENTSFRVLAEMSYEAGDIARAKKYIAKSFADANFYAARMRNAQSSRILPVIDNAYQARQKKMAQTLRNYLVIITFLASGLVLALIYIIFQFANLKKAHGKVTEAKDELAGLYEEVRTTNESLARANEALSESNTIKEAYVGQFMEYSSTMINTLEQYRKSLYLMATTGDHAGLNKALKSNQSVDNALRDFYSAFDSAFLNIFPSFVESFNALLKPDGQLDIRPGEKLNTELRVFALIRLGINDSSKIAQFLRCSITTIYTYRSKTKKQALVPETFEADVARISSY